MSNTNTHSRRGRFHIFSSLGDFRNWGKFESMKHDFSFFFKGEISFVFLFYRLKILINSNCDTFTSPRTGIQAFLTRRELRRKPAQIQIDCFLPRHNKKLKTLFPTALVVYRNLLVERLRMTGGGYSMVRLGKSGSINSFGKSFWGVR